MSGARLIGISAKLDGNWPVSGFDMSGLVRRLLLFDGYVIKSVRLLEFRFLGEHLGYARTRDLLDTGLIEIRNEIMQPAEMLNRSLGPYVYRMNWIDYHDRWKSTSDNLSDLREIKGMSLKENMKFRKAIADRIRPLPTEYRKQVAEAFRDELGNRVLQREAFKLALARHQIKAPDDFNVEYDFDSDTDIFRLKTDLASKYALPADAVHNAGRDVLLGLGTLTQQIAEMSYYKALSGFREEESPLFRLKVGEFLSRQSTTETQEFSFQKTLDVARLPAYDYACPLNVDRLLRVREDQNTAIFRDWLARNGDASEAELLEMLTSFRSTIAQVLESPSSSMMRLIVTTAAGCVPRVGPVLGFGASLLDTLLGAVIPKSGVAGFLHKSYPSLFDRK